MPPPQARVRRSWISHRYEQDYVSSAPGVLSRVGGDPVPSWARLAPPQLGGSMLRCYHRRSIGALSGLGPKEPARLARPEGARRSRWRRALLLSVTVGLAERLSAPDGAVPPLRGGRVRQAGSSPDAWAFARADAEGLRLCRLGQRRGASRSPRGCVTLPVGCPPVATSGDRHRVAGSDLASSGQAADASVGVERANRTAFDSVCLYGFRCALASSVVSTTVCPGYVGCADWLRSGMESQSMTSMVGNRNRARQAPMGSTKDVCVYWII